MGVHRSFAAIAFAAWAGSASLAVAQRASGPRVELALERRGEDAASFGLVVRAVGVDGASRMLGLDELMDRYVIDASLGQRAFEPTLHAPILDSEARTASFALPDWPGRHRLLVTLRSNDSALAATGEAFVRVDQEIGLHAVRGRGPRCAHVHPSVSIRMARLDIASRAFEQKGGSLYLVGGRPAGSHVRGPAELCVEAPAWRSWSSGLDPRADASWGGLLGDPKRRDPTVRLYLSTSMNDPTVGIGTLVVLALLGVAAGLRRERKARKARKAPALAYACAGLREERGYRDDAKARLSAPVAVRDRVDFGDPTGLRVAAREGVFEVDADADVVVFGADRSKPVRTIGRFTVAPGAVVVAGDLAIALFDQRTERRARAIVAALSPEVLAAARREDYAEVPAVARMRPLARYIAILRLGAATTVAPVAVVAALHARWPVFGATNLCLATLYGSAILVLVVTRLFGPKPRFVSASAPGEAPRTRT